MTDKLLTLKEAAARTGLSEYHLQAAVRRGDLPSVNIGTGARVHLRFPAAPLDQYVASLPNARVARA